MDKGSITFIRNLSRSHDSGNLFEIGEIWAQTSVHTDNLVIYNSSNGKAVEAVTERFPDFEVISSFTYSRNP